MLLNGAQAIRFQISVWVPMALLNIILSIYLASRIGIAGVALGSVFAVVVMLVVPPVMYIPRLLRRLEHDGSLALPSVGPDEFRESPS